MTSVAAYVQAGGRSSRFGRDKALAKIDGKNAIERVVAAVAPVAVEVVIVAAESHAYDQLGVRVVRDLRPAAGPLAGIETALSDATTPWVLVVACDLPFLRPELFRLLLRVAGERPAARAIVPADADGRLQTLAALYSRQCLPEVRAALDRNEHAIHRFLETEPIEVLPWTEIEPIEDAALLFRDLDTPEDYERARTTSTRGRRRSEPG